ncbi:hypothetical protein [Acutalibacter sp.]|jgi:hypothetical protein|uniref:hypothetical protein n=1 Tax=Acutalibacter sp. TaxID=1918636 RepID=UPI00216BC5DD|nr:hypothetical protein [Acutalibacter sp.]
MPFLNRLKGISPFEALQGHYRAVQGILWLFLVNPAGKKPGNRKKGQSKQRPS